MAKMNYMVQVFDGDRLAKTSHYKYAASAWAVARKWQATSPFKNFTSVRYSKKIEGTEVAVTRWFADGRPSQTWISPNWVR